MDVYVVRGQHCVEFNTDPDAATLVVIDNVKRISLSAVETQKDEVYPPYWRTLTVQTSEGTIEIELSAEEPDPLIVEL